MIPGLKKFKNHPENGAMKEKPLKCPFKSLLLTVLGGEERDELSSA